MKASASPLSQPQATAPAYLGENQNRHSAKSPETAVATPPLPTSTRPPHPAQHTPEDSEEEPPAPSLPQRPPSQQVTPQTQYATPLSPVSDGVAPSPPYNRLTSQARDESRTSPGGFRMFHINEMVSAIGKSKKLPTTLGLNIGTGTIMIAPEKSRDGPQQEWTAEKLQHYSIEGKHVFMELLRPSKSVDLHAGNKDTATEIVSCLGDIAGAARAEGLREILEISGVAQRKGRMLYEFTAQQDDEVSVNVDDEVMILDETKSNEWWVVRRVKDAKEGVVPSSYVEPMGKAAPEASTSGLNAGKSMKEQNRVEEERLAKEAVQRSKSHKKSESKGLEVGPGLKLPSRGSSLMSRADGNSGPSQKTKRDSKSETKSASSSKTSTYSLFFLRYFVNNIIEPDISKTRTWTDRSGSFKVEAQFLGLKDAKIHLHKLNGVKIAVPVAKMAVEDLEYVERATGQSLDDEKPLSDIRRRSTQVKKGDEPRRSTKSPPSASVGPSRSTPRATDYDWFDFFLKAGVSPYQCQRYTDNFNKDSMDEAILPEITTPVLRTLGLKEGDILRVMKYLDVKFERTGNAAKAKSAPPTSADGKDDEVSSPGGLFSGPGGTLRNNTRKGRPAPVVQTNNSVSADTFKQPVRSEPSAQKATTPLSGLPNPPKDAGSFDDDAWDVKPAKQDPGQDQTQNASAVPASTSAPSRPPTGALAELSLLTPPLQPTPSQNNPPPQQQASTQQALPPLPVSVPSPSNIQPQPTSVNPAFPPPTNPNHNSLQQQQQQQMAPIPAHPTQQPMGQAQLSNPPRQRPQAPVMPQSGTFLPPPPRPLSAPQNAPPNNAFGLPALMPQLTGYQPNQAIRPAIAPQGQSLDELSALRRQQLLSQSQPLFAQPTGFQPQPQNYGQVNNGSQPQATGFAQQQLSPQQNGFHNTNQIGQIQYGNAPLNPQPTAFQPMALQPTGYQPHFHSPLQNQPTGINSVLQPALQPQQTGINGFGGRPGFGQPPTPAPPLPPLPQQLTPQPLIPQKTGPAPPVSFGANKLIPQPTGRRANLSQASKFIEHIYRLRALLTTAST